MKFKLDESLPLELAALLGDSGFDADTVPEEKLSGRDDDAIWDAVQRGEMFFITQDLDFSDIRRFLPHSHYGIMLLRLREPSRRALIERMRFICSDADLREWAGCFVVDRSENQGPWPSPEGW